jgi:hypothetical protein
MKSSPSFKRSKYNWRVGIVKKNKKNHQSFMLLAALSYLISFIFIVFVSHSLYNASPYKHRRDSQYKKIEGIHLKDWPFLTAKSKSADTSGGVTEDGAIVHQGVVSTVFWVGESSNASNGYIANNESAWDEQWQQNFGGIDDPELRNDYLPAKFTPKENPFYIALPYNDIDSSGKRKTTAGNCLAYSVFKQDNYSWCKNIWVKIRHNQKELFAQWQDVGPYEEDDTGYVFGQNAPKNKNDARAGIDVSPSVRNFLDLSDVDKVDWSFVTPASVTEGPWKQTVTKSTGNSLN